MLLFFSHFQNRFLLDPRSSQSLIPLQLTFESVPRFAQVDSCLHQILILQYTLNFLVSTILWLSQLRWDGQSNDCQWGQKISHDGWYDSDQPAHVSFGIEIAIPHCGDDSKNTPDAISDVASVLIRSLIRLLVDFQRIPKNDETNCQHQWQDLIRAWCQLRFQGERRITFTEISITHDLRLVWEVIWVLGEKLED